MSVTARELADQVVAARQKAWEKSDPTTAVVSTEQLNPDDAATIKRMVAAEGYVGQELEEMIRKVTALVIGRVEALADDMPADNSD